MPSMDLHTFYLVTVVFLVFVTLIDTTSAEAEEESARGVKQRGRPHQRRNNTFNRNKRPPRFWNPAEKLKYQKQKAEKLASLQNSKLPLWTIDSSRQPSPKLKSRIEFDSAHHLFYIASPNSFRIRMAPGRKKGSPWPMPQYYEVKTAHFNIDPSSFKVYVKHNYNDILEFNLKRLWSQVFSIEYHEDEHRVKDDQEYIKTMESSKLNQTDDLKALIFLEINITASSYHYPTATMKESYNFRTRQDGVLQLDCEHVWGAIRGLETISQLILENDNVFFLRDVIIKDYPRFSYRGLMIDTSRHFIHMKTLLENLEAMAQNKLNVFHWHMTDDQSFPFESYAFPNITKYGAFHPETHVYRKQDVAEIVEAARLRGIRVIPEFDSPGHTFAWGYGQPDLLTPCHFNGAPAFFGPMNPLWEKTYEVLHTMYEEIVDSFPDNLIHIGGDEVFKECWLSNPEMKANLTKQHLTLDKMMVNFTSRLQRSIDTIVKTRSEKRDPKVYGKEPLEMLAWQEAFDERRNLTKNTIIQIWKNDERFARAVTMAGYKAIFSSCWYLDSTVYGIDWDRMYNCLTSTKSDKTDYNGNLIGGEICMWTEYVDDQLIMPRMWPRASAAAERLWSKSSQEDLQEAGGRIEEHNCRMKSRGINSGVLSGPGFCDLAKSSSTPNFKIPAPVVISHSGRTSIESWQNHIERQLGALRHQSESSSFLQIVIIALVCLLLKYIFGIRFAQMPIINKVSNTTVTARILRLKKRHILLVTGFLVFLTLVINILRLSKSPTITSKYSQR